MAAVTSRPQPPHPSGDAIAPPDRVTLFVSTTWHCNLACSYCFVHANRGERDSERMTPARAARLVEALLEIPGAPLPSLIHVYGGEPLTNLPALRAMVERARAASADSRLAFGITTNGTILDDEVFQLLEAGGFDISLSIDGPPEIHDSCRRTADGRPTHDVVIEFLRRVRERTGCQVRGSAVIRPGWGLADARRYLEGLGVESFKAQVVRVPDTSPFALPPKDRTRYLEDIESAARGVIDDLEAGRRPKDGRFTGRALQLLAGLERRPAFCDVGEHTFGVTPCGDVVPCILIHPVERVLGHIDDHPLTWINEGRRWRRSRALRAECRECPQVRLCGGGCPAIMPVCGAGECEFLRRECEMAARIHEHFRQRPETLLILAGIR